MAEDRPKNFWDVIVAGIKNPKLFYVLIAVALVGFGISSGEEIVGWLVEIIHAIKGTG